MGGGWVTAPVIHKGLGFVRIYTILREHNIRRLASGRLNMISPHVIGTLVLKYVHERPVHRILFGIFAN